MSFKARRQKLAQHVNGGINLQPTWSRTYVWSPSEYVVGSGKLNRNEPGHGAS